MGFMPSASDLLLVGLLLAVIGGVLAMKGTIHHDAATAPAAAHRVHMSLRRSLPRHGLCPVGVTVMIVGVACVIASYLVRM
jgi:hypothetical protein